jgi:hypothetical protein
VRSSDMPCSKPMMASLRYWIWKAESDTDVLRDEHGGASPLVTAMQITVRNQRLLRAFGLTPVRPDAFASLPLRLWLLSAWWRMRGH